MMKKMFVAIFVILFSGSALADATQIARGTIYRMGSTYSNGTPDAGGDQFVIYVLGTGVPACINTSTTGWNPILFPVSAGANADSLRRAYTAALTAMTLHQQVIIWNYASSNCAHASYISVDAQ